MVPDSSLGEKARRLIRAHARTLSPKTLGQGTDPYSPSALGDLRFSMALGLYVGALARVAPELVPSGSGLLQAGVGHLINLRGSEGVWGLPFAWKDSPPRTPMTITTTIAATGLLRASQHGWSLGHEAALREAVNWLCNGIPWSERGQGACPWFAKGWPILVTNVASKTGGLLMDAGRTFELRDCIERARTAAHFVCAQQRPSGAWTYGLPDERSPRSTDVVDVTHVCYTLEGLLKIYSGREALPDALAETIQSTISRGLEFVNRDLCGSAGLREKVWILSEAELGAMRARAHATRVWHNRREADGKYVVFHPEEPRLWSLGALLTLHAYARQAGWRGLTRVADVLERIESLRTRAGRFRYRTDDEHVYVRHEAHVFAGLVDLLATGAVSED